MLILNKIIINDQEIGKKCANILIRYGRSLGCFDYKDITKLNFGEGDRGWKGDVPIVRLNSEKIRNIGWTNKYNSKQAIFESVSQMFNKLKNQ